MSAILKQKLIDIANGFTKYGLWKGGGSGESSFLNVEITKLWSGQQSYSSEITLSDDYENYDVIISMIEPLEDYPTQQKFDFMLKGEKSLTGGMAENSSYITSYRLNNWNGTSVFFNRDSNPSGWNVTLRKIWGIKFISQLPEYSTEEKVVGKWIDGKTIYQKTFTELSLSLDFVEWKPIAYIPNIDNIICGFGIDNYKQLFNPMALGYADEYIYWNQSKPITNILNTLTVQYTKTTD